MAGKREKPEETVSKLRQVEVLHGQGARSDGIGVADLFPDCQVFGLLFQKSSQKQLVLVDSPYPRISFTVTTHIGADNVKACV